MDKVKRFFEEVRAADAAQLTPREICIVLGFNPDNWPEVWAAARIYAEDGGQRYSEKEFADAINPETPPEIQEMFQEFMRWTLGR